MARVGQASWKSAHGVFEALAGTERGARRGRDLDLLAGPGVTPGAGFTLPGLEAAEAGDLDLLPTLQRFADDAVFNGEESVHRAGRIYPA